MTLPQLRVKLVVAAGIVGASLLGATFVGCQTSGPGPQSGPFGQLTGGMNGQQQANNMYGGQPQQFAGGGPAGNGYLPPMNGMPSQNRQAFMNETQRIGYQQNLSPQDVVAMQRAGVPDQQIAAAIQQRGGAMAATPGMPQYLAQNGVNPAVLDASRPQAAGMAGPQASPFQMAQADASTPFQQMPGAGTPAAAHGALPTGYPMAQADPGQAQTAGYETPAPTTGFETPSPASNGGVPGQSWRSMSR